MKYIIECNEEELSAVFLGLKILHQSLINDINKRTADIKTVENLHQRLRPDVQEAIDRQASQIPPTTEK